MLPKSVLSIGRDPTNDLVLPDSMVSRRHAVVEYQGSQYFLRDCSSSNGVLVNGDRVSERTLRDGDVVAIGSSRLLFRDDVESFDDAGKVVQHPSAPRLKCPKCQANYLRNEIFCRSCGERLQQPKAKVVCPSCGTATPEPAAFCNSCGARIGESHEAPPEPPVARGGQMAEPAVVPPELLQPLMMEPPASVPSLVEEPQPAARGARAVTARPSADWSVRLVAGLLDFAVVGLIQVGILGPLAYSWWTRDLTAEVPFLPILASVALVIATLTLGGCYFAYFWGVRGATPGKQALGLLVEGEDGEFPIGMPRAALRFVAYLFSAALFGVGFLMIAVDGYGLHDRVARTRVTVRAKASS